MLKKIEVDMVARIFFPERKYKWKNSSKKVEKKEVRHETVCMAGCDLGINVKIQIKH